MQMNTESIPFSWDNVSIGQYAEIMAVNDMKCDDIDKCVQWLSILTGNDEDHYLDMKLPLLQEEFKKLAFLSTEMKPLEPRFKNGKYKVGDTQLILTPSSNAMTAGQFIDYQNTLATSPEDTAMLCAIVLVPKGCTYNNGYDVFDLKQTLYEQFPIVDALGISFFFQKMYDVLRATILRSSRKALRREMKKREILRDPEKIKTLQEAIRKIEVAESILSGRKQ